MSQARFKDVEGVFRLGRVGFAIFELLVRVFWLGTWGFAVSGFWSSVGLGTGFGIRRVLGSLVLLSWCEVFLCCKADLVWYEVEGLCVESLRGVFILSFKCFAFVLGVDLGLLWFSRMCRVCDGVGGFLEYGKLCFLWIGRVWWLEILNDAFKRCVAIDSGKRMLGDWSHGFRMGVGGFVWIGTSDFRFCTIVGLFEVIVCVWGRWVVVSLLSDLL